MLQNRDQTMVAGHYSPRDPVTQPDRVTAAHLILRFVLVGLAERAGSIGHVKHQLFRKIVWFTEVRRLFTHLYGLRHSCPHIRT
jgi:hypothetical protein